MNGENKIGYTVSQRNWTSKKSKQWAALDDHLCTRKFAKRAQTFQLTFSVNVKCSNDFKSLRLHSVEVG